jgi:DNA repair exonuclease SbcCD ATPase subunit
MTDDKALEKKAREWVVGVAEHECGAYIGSSCPTCDYRIPRLLVWLREVAEDARREAEAEVERLRMRVSSLETQWAESDTAAAIFQAMSRAEQAEAEVERLREALAEIAKGEGRYNCAPLIHAFNTIEDMQALAITVLRGEGEKP